MTGEVKPVETSVSYIMPPPSLPCGYVHTVTPVSPSKRCFCRSSHGGFFTTLCAAIARRAEASCAASKTWPSPHAAERPAAQSWSTKQPGP